ncbi:MAG TPA: hypothetical protein PKI94_08455, partial [Candidatus Gastranaerophilaceae bacterium]|nr:hypothetical protein [Candidatus Gastranaerophilaceae bacterium]
LSKRKKMRYDNYEIRKKKLDNLYSYKGPNFNYNGGHNCYMNSIFSSYGNCQISNAQKSLNTWSNIMNGISIGTAIAGMFSAFKKTDDKPNPFKPAEPGDTTQKDVVTTTNDLEAALNTALETDNWQEVKNQLRTSKNTLSANQRTLANYDTQIQKAQADLNITTGIIDDATTQNNQIDTDIERAETRKTQSIEAADTEFTTTEATINSQIAGLEQGVTALQGTPGAEAAIDRINQQIAQLRAQKTAAEQRCRDAKTTAEQTFTNTVTPLNETKTSNESKILEYTPVKETQTARLTRLSTEKTTLTTNNQALAQKITLAESRLQQYGRN